MGKASLKPQKTTFAAGDEVLGFDSENSDAVVNFTQAALVEAVSGAYPTAFIVAPGVATVAGDGVTDDTAAIQAVLDLAMAETSAEVWFAPATYLLNTESFTVGVGLSFALYINASNMRLRFAEGATLKTTADRNLLFITGAPDVEAFTTYWLGDPTKATYYEIDPAELGERSITTATAADAGNFAAGDWLHIRTGSLGAASVTEPDAELNQVISANAGTGVITLRYPLVKPYEQEYFISGTAGKTSTSVTANAATFGVADISDRTIENISIEGLRVDTAATIKSPIVVKGGVVGLNISDYKGVTGGSPFDGFEFRWATFRDWDLHMDSFDSGALRWLVATATTCSDVIIENVHGTGTGGRQLIGHFHEGSANVYVRRLVVVSDVGADDGNPLSVRARAYNHVYEDIDIVSGGSVSAYVDDTCTGGVTLIRPRVVIEGDPTLGLRISGAGSRLIDPHPDTVIDDEVDAWHAERIRIPAASFGAVAGSAAMSTIASRWRGLNYDATSEESAAVAVEIPAHWQSIHLDIYWTNNGAGSGDVRWFTNLDRAGDGETINASAGGGSAGVTATAPAQNVLEVTRLVTAQAVDGTKLLNLRVVRQANAAADTLGNDAAVLEALVTRAR